MFVGLDVHKNYLQAAVVDGRGTLLKEGRIPNRIDEIRMFFADVDDAKIVIESSSAWYHIYELLSKSHKVVLSNPVKTKAIASAKVKTDRVDALTLANLLRGGYIAESYVPPRRIMDLREMVRHRASLVRIRTSLKNRIHAYLLMHGLRMEGTPFSKMYVDRLRAIHDYRIDGYLNLIEALNREIDQASRMIMVEAKDDEYARLLRTIPGVGYYSALLVVSEIGEIERFPDSAHLRSYAGLTPSTHSSGGVTYHGNITKTGSRDLRWILTECTHNHIRTEPDSNITKFHNRLAKRKGKAKATNAIIAIGDLEGIRDQDKGRHFNRRLASQPFYLFKQYLTYKANWEGIRVITVPEAYTSQTCHRCGMRGQRVAGRFSCQNCGLVCDADVNGAWNIRKRAHGLLAHETEVVLTPPGTLGEWEL
jgi:IS605 OrfB family transposase